MADTPLAGDAALALYRAAQEGVTNALRHGGADLIELSLSRHGSDIVRGGDTPIDGRGCRSVRRDGTGGTGDPPRRGHYGLRWIAERVGALGGAWRLSRAPTRGV